MSVRELLEGECGAENSLVRLGGHAARDTAFKDEGFSRAQNASAGFRPEPGVLNEQQLVNEFFREFSGPPQVWYFNLKRWMKLYISNKPNSFDLLLDIQYERSP